MKKRNVLATALLLSTSLPASAELDITITNLTNGIYFTPFLVGAHNSSADVFSSGQAASAELRAMAEGGDISGLATTLNTAGANVVENPAGGMLAPAMSTTTTVMNSAGNDYLSIVAMLLPTNDGFAGLDSWKIPTTPGTYTLNLNAYDAGTEANDELLTGGGAPGVAGIPGAPGGDTGMNGTGVTTTETNTTVHIHRGSLGDDDLTGGASDLDNRIHRWLNPVVRVTVVVR